MEVEGRKELSVTTRTQTQQGPCSALLRTAPIKSRGRNRGVRVVGVLVLVLLLVSACDAPDPEIHQLVALGWGSPVRPTFCDIAYGPERGCPSGSDEPCGGSQELDIYRVRTGGNRGVLVYLHGGGYVAGDKYPLGDLGNIKRQLHRGYSIVSMNYRLPPVERDATGELVLERAGPIGWPFPQSLGENGFRPAMADVAAALHWVYESGPAYGLSTGTVAVVGHSAGGTIAALAALAANSPDPIFSDLPTVDAWVAISAPLSWDSFADGPRWAKVWMGDDYASDRHRSNPINHFDPEDPPGYVIAGVNDGIVPVENVQAFHRHARSIGLNGDLGVTVDIVDRLADGRPIAPSVIGQPDPRNHCPIGGMNAAWFDLWLDDR